MRLPLTLAALLLAAPAFAQEVTPAAPAQPEATASAPAAPASAVAASEAPPPAIPDEAPATAAPEAPPPETLAPVATDAPEAPAAVPASEAPATVPDAPLPATTQAPGAATTPATPAVRTPIELEVPDMALTPKEMFLEADMVVKAVMIGLAFASVVTWTVFLVKLIELAAAIRRARTSHRRIEDAGDIASALQATDRRSDPASAMIRAAAREMERSAPALASAGQQGVKERVASHLDRIEARASRRISRGTGLLATVGSTAPFVGLFGTVWGIMNSFIGIAEAQTTNLSIVAPGIAEALLATGIGLVAAIPAVVIYNMFARATAGYRLQLGDAAASVQRLVSRELDMNGVRP